MLVNGVPGTSREIRLWLWISKSSDPFTNSSHKFRSHIHNTTHYNLKHQAYELPLKQDTMAAYTVMPAELMPLGWHTYRWKAMVASEIVLKGGVRNDIVCFSTRKILMSRHVCASLVIIWVIISVWCFCQLIQRNWRKIADIFGTW